MFQDQTLQTLIRGIRYEIQCLQFLRQCNCGRLKGILGDRLISSLKTRADTGDGSKKNFSPTVILRQSKFHELTSINEDKTQIIEYHNYQLGPKKF